MKKTIFKFFVVGVLGFNTAAARPLPGCPALEIRIDSRPAATFYAHLANTPEARSLGLMGVQHLPADQAMLFDFGRDQNVGFWMKDTLIPLDMVFISAAGLVTSIHENAIPHDEATIVSTGPVRYVLEINGGLSENLGLEAGQQVTAMRAEKECKAASDGTILQ